MLLVFAATWIKPLWPYEQALHGSLTVVGFVLLWLLCRPAGRFALGDRHLFFISLSLSVHSVAARWLYSYVPYNAWIESISGFSVNRHFGWTRNHFDRLVHFLFGLCFTPFIASYAARRFKLLPLPAFYIRMVRAGNCHDDVGQGCRGLQRAAGRHVGCAQGHADGHAGQRCLGLVLCKRKCPRSCARHEASLPIICRLTMPFPSHCQETKDEA